jgi:hypothetical protein
MLENLIQEFTTGAEWVTPKDYYLMRLEQIKEVPYKFNGKDCIMFVEVHQVVYEGRKRKNITEYGQVITIDICDKNNDGINDFQTVKLVSKHQHTFRNGYDEIVG